MRGAISLLCLTLVAGLSSCTLTARARPQPTPAPAASAAASPAASPSAQASAAATPTVAVSEALTFFGTVMPAQDADLSFGTQGIVARVLVKEGDQVQPGDLLAVLDTRALDQQVAQAEANLASARAGRVALDEGPSEAQLQAAQAQVRQAEIGLAQAQVAQPQTVEAARAAVAQAQASLQQTRDALSAQKTQAEQRMFQAAEAVVQAQAAYSQAYWNEEFVERTGANPNQPYATLPNGEQIPNDLADIQKLPYSTALKQAAAQLRSSEQALEAARIEFENARQAEITGIAQAEQQLAQTQTNLNKLQLDGNSDQIAAAQVSVDQANANLRQLYASPRQSDLARAAASVQAATAALEGARVARASAELYAPFAGTIGQVNISPGAPSSPAAGPPIYLVDISALHVDVPVSDVLIGRVQLGQRATISADALPGRSFAGEVSYIAPSATVSGNVRTYTVRLAIADPAGMRAGMSVQVAFESSGA